MLNYKCVAIGELPFINIVKYYEASSDKNAQDKFVTYLKKENLISSVVNIEVDIATSQAKCKNQIEVVALHQRNQNSRARIRKHSFYNIDFAKQFVIDTLKNPFNKIIEINELVIRKGSVKSKTKCELSEFII
jgi:hypothetical protein